MCDPLEEMKDNDPNRLDIIHQNQQPNDLENTTNNPFPERKKKGSYDTIDDTLEP